MTTWRLYIDESGDHTYKNINNLDTQYLGLTGVLIRKRDYYNSVKLELEALKQHIFRYDPDDPPILTRSFIKHRKFWFYVLQTASLNTQWENELLTFVRSLRPYTQIFTAVFDKRNHFQQYPVQTFDAYSYCLHVLVNRVRGFLVNQLHETADILAESRGRIEDQQLVQAYNVLITIGSHFGNAQYYQSAYPEPTIMIKRKDQNIAGLQIADIVAYGQKIQTLIDHQKPIARPLGNFTTRLNTVVNTMVNQYGRTYFE